MARPEAVAVGGYYKTPTHLIPRIAPLLSPHLNDEGEISFIDPCAGDGEAILGLMRALLKNLYASSAQLYACEMEATRAAALKKLVSESTSHWLSKGVVHGDAFRLTFNRKDKHGASVLFLNPPYDIDRVYGRLENKFLTRFSSALMDGGALLFLVPHYALRASAEFIAQEYRDVRCFKFPAEDFEAFKQVVLFARKRTPLAAPDARTVKQIQGWAEDVSGLPELPNIASEPLCELPAAPKYYGGLGEWAMRPVDVVALTRKAKPWVQTTRGGTAMPVHGILPDLPIQSLLLRQYPVATPPRPAHIAAGIASGLFNGARVEPTDPSVGLPALLVKGVFDQEYRTVEQKLDKDGAVRALVQVQQPRLVATVLDLSTHQYHTLKAGDAGTPSIEGLTVAGLLKYYGDSLMAVMEQQCPILYDPRKDGDSIQLAPTARRLFSAQGHAAKAIVRLLGGPTATKKERSGKAAILLGEIGSGKTSVALAVSNTVGSKRPLVLCPPHLLTSWRNEAAAVLPDADVRVLTSIGELEAVANDKSDRTIISLVSRETAKLSHGWEGVGAVCPKCGGMTPAGVDLAKKRSRCENVHVRGRGPTACLALKMANQLSRFAPQNATIHSLLRGRHDQKRLEVFAQRLEQQPPKYPGFVASYFDEILPELINSADPYIEALVWILLALGDAERIERSARAFLELPGYRDQELGRNLLLLLPPHDARQTAVVAEQQAKRSNSYSSWDPWHQFTTTLESVKSGESHVRIGNLSVSWADGKLKVSDVESRTLEAACEALYGVYRLAGFRFIGPCDEFLFQAVPEPRRIALAQHIVRRHRDVFDFLILDEAHEYASDGSAQERSAHRLTGLGLPTILMTGTIMNGYAKSLFTNMWAVSPAFRNEFQRSDEQRFIDRYGYRKRIVDVDEDKIEVAEFGAMSDRVVQHQSGRVVGNAPGILPLFLLRHLLPISVTLHKTDLALDLPLCRQERCLVEPDSELKSRYDRLQQALVNRIKHDQFDPELAGRLFGQLAELPSYLDRSTRDTGNTEDGVYEIRYPESVGSALVASQEAFDSSEVLPKEQWLLDKIDLELSEGRNIMVFTWHVNLLPRLSDLIAKHTGLKVPILYANKVPTAKRQDWIDRQIVNRGARVMVTNPVAIQTGLNNLVHFATEIWMENPACNPIIFRQAMGRVDRIGQQLETRIYSPIYAGTLQVTLYDLLLKKVAVSVSTDGLDPESALLAAGVGEDEYLTGLSIGKQLWAMLSDGVVKEERGTVYKPGKREDVLSMLASVEE